jgi:hypothetical protein
MKRAITVAGDLEGGTTIVLTGWPRWVNVVASAVVSAAGVVAPTAPAAPAAPVASGVVSGLPANALRAAVVAAAKAPPRALEPEPRIASEVTEMESSGLGEDTTGIVGELGVVATGGAVIGVVTAGVLGAWVGVGVGVGVGAGVGVDAGLGVPSPGGPCPWCFSWPGGVPP